MPISENQLRNWAQQGTTQPSAETYRIIKQVLEDQRAPFARSEFNVYLQGSYDNSTNVQVESDVDIAICLSSIFCSDTGDLNDGERALYNPNFMHNQYSFNEFKRQVSDWLRTNFGNSVTVGNKAISVPGCNGRLNADVLTCVKHRHYYSNPLNGRPSFYDGICFWTAQGNKIVNYPRQHKDNCTMKHCSTHDRFKPNIRVLKNMRWAMVNNQYLGAGVAPSYFLEGMFYNVPNAYFTFSYQESLNSALSWLELCDPQNLVCANKRHCLIRDGSDICWNIHDYRTFLSEVRRYWDNR